MVEGTGLENRQSVKAFEGSNPSLSAKKKDDQMVVLFYCRDKGVRLQGGPVAG